MKRRLRGSERRSGMVKRSMERITDGFKDRAACRVNSFLHQRVMPGQSRRHDLRLPPPKRGAAFHVGKQKRHGAG